MIPTVLECSQSALFNGILLAMLSGPWYNIQASHPVTFACNFLQYRAIFNMIFWIPEP